MNSKIMTVNNLKIWSFESRIINIIQEEMKHAGFKGIKNNLHFTLGNCNDYEINRILNFGLKKSNEFRLVIVENKTNPIWLRSHIVYDR